MSLICGAVGVLLLFVFFLTIAGSGVLYTGLIAGVIGIVSGAVALAKRQGRGPAVTGIVLGAITVLAAVGTVIFALIFVGAIRI